MAYLWVQDEIRSQRLRVRRVRSEENVADLGTEPLSKTAIAKHCLTLGYANMDEENVQSGWQGVAMFWDFGSAAGDHVQKSGRSDQQQSQDPQQQRASRNCSRCQRGCCSTLLRIVTHCSNRLRKVQTRRTHTIYELLRGNIIRVGAERSVARNPRQVFTEHHEVRR